MPDIPDGQTAEMQGSGSKPYILKNVGGVYSCSCPAWRNQSVPIERRTCKHLRKYRGDAAEEARLNTTLPQKPTKPDGAEEGADLPLLLAENWTDDTDPTGWWMSEKLDGVRAYWDGKQFLSRKNNIFYAPDWFTAGLPPMALDGELWMARGEFQRTVSVVRRQDHPPEWKQVRFVVFDAPQARGTFEKRIEWLGEVSPKWKSQFLQLHSHEECEGLEDLVRELERVLTLGGEGLMLRKPGSKYEFNRSSTLLKVKKFHDAEAKVVAHEPGKGRHKGRLGAVVAELPNGKRFNVGTGFSDKQRESPPAIGSTVTFKYQELTKDGIPRFPVFIGVRIDAPAVVAPLIATPPAAATVTTKAKASGAGPRMFENTSGGASKFWEVSVSGSSLTTRWGKIGSDGQTKTKTFATAEKAQSEADKLVGEKTAGGYVEK
jgi:DNA ligase-1